MSSNFLRGAIALTTFTCLIIGVAYLQLAPPTLVAPVQEPRIITDVTILNPGAPDRIHQSIVIDAGRIIAIRPVAADDPAPLCRGCFAMPGLIDAHVHTPPAMVLGNQQYFALLYLAHGVTSIRDVGQSESAIATFAGQLNGGLVPGPHMYRCGPVLDGNPPGWPVAQVVETAAQASQVVTQLFEAGVDCIKVYNELDPQVFLAVAAKAKQLGLPLIGHVPHKVGLAGLVDFEVQHMTGVPYLHQTRPPVGWDIRTEDLLAMKSADIEAVMALASRQRLSFTPTLANFSLRLIASDVTRFPPGEAGQLLPNFWARGWDFVAGHPEGELQIQNQLKSLPVLAQLTRAAHDAGMDILAGTDTLMPWVVPGQSLQLEIQTLASALGDKEIALESATRINGKHIDLGAIGVLVPNARADILLLNEDPRHDLSAVTRWHSLIIDGRYYSRAQIDRWLAQYQRYFDQPLYRLVMDNLIGLIARLHGSTQAA